jgi:TrkA domain protein
MEFRETDLPGIGKKYSITTAKGDKVAVVIHLTGKREIFYFEAEDLEDPVCDIVLNEEEASQLGSVLMGAYFKPEQEHIKEVLLHDLAIEWVKVKDNSPLVNKSIADSQIRKKTGVTVISIIRGDKSITNPLPEEVIYPGDVLVLVGTREQIEHFLKEFNLNAW